MSIKYKIYPARNLLVDVLKENISLNELKISILQKKNNSDYIYVSKVLTNIIDTNFDLSTNDLYRFLSFIIPQTSNSYFRWAILTDKPRETAFALLVKNNDFFENRVEVFTTLNACNKYLDILFEKDEFKDDDYIEITV